MTADLGLRIPLRGVQLIEASAGTGKTFTLATLHARLVIEARCPVTAVLAVTFTEAATKELRERLRERLLLAARLAEGAAVDAGDEAQRLTALLVEAAVAREGAAPLRHRLQAAAQAMDLAPIHTLHGFCRRVLAEHALEAGAAPGEVELLENERALREEVATDLWRDLCGDPARFPLLAAQWSGPAALARDLGPLLHAEQLRPAPPGADAGDSVRTRLAEAAAALAEAFRRHGDSARTALDAACAGGIFHRARLKPEWIDPVWAALAAWTPGDALDEPALKRLECFSCDGLAQRLNKGRQAPVSPLFEAIGAWCRASEEVARHQALARIGLVHGLRERARARLSALKRARAQRGFDDLVGDLADALAGGGDALAAALRARWPVALVDEFQDTDPRQWSIFRRLYAEAGTPDPDAAVRALFLIGDPKQAIYRFRGGDVHTYLAAAACAEARWPLARNFRSRPSVLATVQALFQAGRPGEFAQDGIDFVPVASGGRVVDADCLEGDAPAPALHVARLPPDADGKPLGVSRARRAAAVACAAAVRGLLDGDTRLRDGGGLRAVRPGDVAVLVEKHRDALSVRDALVAAGVPCVAAGRASLYASDEAADLLGLLDAVADVTDDGRLRAALATPWFGLDAAAIAALDTDTAAHRGWQDRVLAWRERIDRHGVLALVNEIAAAAAPRVLGLVDGERRLGNLLQLAELLQESPAAAGGVSTLREELGRRMHAADPDTRAERLRLDSDAARVAIMTVHAAKGLEFPFVFLPFVATGGTARPQTGLRTARYQEAAARITALDSGDQAWDRARALDAAEQRAESLRLLYVALTRARLATWLCWGPVNGLQGTALAWLLHADCVRGEKPKAPDAAAIDARLAALAQQAPGMRVLDAATAPPPGRPRLETAAAPPPAPPATRRPARDWWIYSFSQLAREDAGGEDDTVLEAPVRGAGDEPADAELDRRFSGARFGNVLHDALERVDFARWRDVGQAVPPEEAPVLAEALRAGGYGGQEVLADGLRLLAGLVAATLNAPLPEGLRLCELPPPARRAEMEFHFAMAPVAVDALLGLLHAHDVLRGRRGFGLRARIQGLMTGFIDLVYRHQGRYYVLDYKSNRLRDYAPPALDAAMRDSEYDLQALIYVLALHRFLGTRIPDYDYDRHLGGVRYLFCRGLDGEAAGIHAARPARALVEGLDALLRGGPAGGGAPA